MRKSILKFFLLFSVCIGQTFGHDIHVALFDLYVQDDHYTIDMRIDREDLENAITKGCGVNMRGFSITKQNLLIEEYITDHFLLHFDDRLGLYTLINYNRDQDFINIKAVIDTVKPSEKPCKILVSNSCLIDKVEKHDNILRVNLYDRMRSFRLNKDRQNTVVEY